MPVELGRHDPHHYVFEALADEAVLWRFMDLPKLLSLLEYRALHFCRADLLGDPFEGALADSFYGRGARVFETIDGETFEVPPIEDESQVQSRRINRLTTSVSCWNHSEYEIEALWSRYASANAGVAVRTTFGRLTTSFGAPLSAGEMQYEAAPVYIGPVSYVDYRTAEWPDYNGFYPFMHKRLSFKHEQEVRAIVYDRGSVNWSTDPPTPGTPESRLIEVDLEVLVAAIVVSPLALPWFADLVGQVVERYGLHVPVERSALVAQPRP